jgi:hypothetical protein
VDALIPLQKRKRYTGQDTIDVRKPHIFYDVKYIFRGIVKHAESGIGDPTKLPDEPRVRFNYDQMSSRERVVSVTGE